MKTKKQYHMRSSNAFKLIAVFMVFCNITEAQIGINQANPDPSSVLHIEAADKGVIIPRLENTDVISDPAEGLIIYNKSEGILMVYNGSRWEALYPYPKGGIIMWSGTAIPDGWALCDGTNGTPDLRGRFIVGYNSSVPDYNNPGNRSTGGSTAGKTGGSASQNHDIVFNASSTFTGNTTAINIQGKTEEVKDDHSRSGYYGGLTGTGWTHDHIIDFSVSYSPQGSVNTTVSSGSGTNKTESADNRPPYYVLAFIMKL